MRLILLLFVGVLLLNGISFGQISQGGKPMEISGLKSAFEFVIEMPAVDNNMLQKQVLEEQKSEIRLKPFRFAHSFDVNFTVQNSGTWSAAGNGFNVWKLKIRSKGARSLNLIFDNFKLPDGARLFLFNETENHFLGAFTSFNNKSFGKFAVSPVAGDEITVQYELPSKYEQDEDFVITHVNHDFVGILKYSDRRPLGKTAGSCNVDINCPLAINWAEVKDAVCRMIVNGKEICTGTLVNNTAENRKPYILSAAHCYDQKEFAATTIFTFNYESPYCAPLDGSPSNSVSGSVMKAQYDSLDFALVEMSLVPPPEFRPYYAGWDRSSNIPDSTVSIHHPQGDIKKIAIDRNAPEFSDFNSSYTKNGFIKILRWEFGVTENGSSGGPLFNPQKNLVGTLTGGVATCTNPVKDYFSRFGLCWDLKSDSTKQLKYWLDPTKSGSSNLSGKQFNSGENFCTALTNLTNTDEHQNVTLLQSGNFSGYWGGTNSQGITDFAERFTAPGNVRVRGVSMGIGKALDAPGGNDSEITVKVYNGSVLPGSVIYSKTVKIKSLAVNAMNYISFDEPVNPTDTFFVGFELSNIQPKDTFVVYQSLRNSAMQNFFYFKQNNLWNNFKESNISKSAMVNVFELVACNVAENVIDTPLVKSALEILVYPNPTPSKFTLEAGQEIFIEYISVYNLIGQKVQVKYGNQESRKIQIDLSGNVPGVYFVRYYNGVNYVTKKVSFVPW